MKMAYKNIPGLVRLFVLAGLARQAGLAQQVEKRRMMTELTELTEPAEPVMPEALIL